MKEKEIYQKIVDNEPYCQLCGSTSYLHIHHIYYRSQLGKTVEKNLIRLCSKCHQLVHSNKRKYQPILLDMQYKKYGVFGKEEVVNERKRLK